MNILVTNDDGVFAPGLWALARELAQVGRVMVVAPDRGQSGVGTAVSLYRGLRVNKVFSLIEDVDAYAVPGTPADCVILGLGSLSEEPVDLVVSGINEGANLGNDVLISGTVGAAFQGFFRGLPSIAISVAAFEDIDFVPAAKTAALLARQVAEHALPNHVLLNVNVPNLPLEQIAGVAITRLAHRNYMDLVETHHDALGRRYYSIVRGKPDWHVARNTDIWAIRKGMISITPLHSDLVHRPSRCALEGWCAAIHQGLLAQGS